MAMNESQGELPPYAGKDVQMQIEDVDPNGHIGLSKAALIEGQQEALAEMTSTPWSIIRSNLKLSFILFIVQVLPFLFFFPSSMSVLMIAAERNHPRYREHPAG